MATSTHNVFPQHRFNWNVMHLKLTYDVTSDNCSEHFNLKWVGTDNFRPPLNWMAYATAVSCRVIGTTSIWCFVYSTFNRHLYKLTKVYEMALLLFHFLWNLFRGIAHISGQTFWKMMPWWILTHAHLAWPSRTASDYPRRTQRTCV